MDFSGSAWTEGLGETKLLIGWTSVERLKLDNRGRSSFGMIAALKATGCAKVVNTQTESQMGKSHTHSQRFKSFWCTAHIQFGKSRVFMQDRRQAFATIIVLFCVCGGVLGNKLILKDSFRQNRTPLQSSAEGKWAIGADIPLANRGNNDKKHERANKQAKSRDYTNKAALLGRRYPYWGTWRGLWLTKTHSSHRFLFFFPK